MFPIIADDVAVGLGNLIGRNVEDQFAGAIRVEDRAVALVVAAVIVVMIMTIVGVIVAGVIVAFVIVAFVPKLKAAVVCSLGRIRLGVAFERVGGTQS